MYSKRPSHFEKEIQKKFDAIPRIKGGYVWTGNSNYSFHFDNELSLHTQAILKTAPQQGSIQTLDIGTSDGSFILTNDSSLKESPITSGQSSHVYGISATDERSSKQPIPDEKYILGNAENLTQTLSKPDTLASLKFNYIFSHKTFLHFVDPLGALVQAYDKLVPGGILVVDEFSVPGCGDCLQDIVKHLRNEGHCLAVSYNNMTGKIEQFCIMKTDIPLKFPVTYHDSKLEYQAGQELKLDQHTPFEKIKLQINPLAGILDELGLKTMRDKHTSLPDLLKSAEYRELTENQQIYLILFVVAKEVCSMEATNQNRMFKLHDNEISLDKILKLATSSIIPQGNEGDNIRSGNLRNVGIGNVILNHPEIPLDTKFDIIRLTACRKLLSMDLGNRKENLKALQIMRIEPEYNQVPASNPLFDDFIKNELLLPRAPEKFTVADISMPEFSSYLAEAINYIVKYKKFLNIPELNNLDSAYILQKIDKKPGGGGGFFILAESPYEGMGSVEIPLPVAKLVRIVNIAYNERSHPEKKVESKVQK